MESDHSSSRRKHSKKKKSKKHKMSRKSREASDSGSESQSEEMEWVEAPSSASAAQIKKKDESSESKTSEIQREEWMSEETFVPTLSNKEIKEQRMKARKNQQNASPVKLGQHARELNPHWKNEGSGVPVVNSCEETTDLKLPSCSVGDGGYSWLKKAYQRVKEKAEDEGRSIEDVAAERWGSLEKLTAMLTESEKRMKANTGNYPERNNKRQYKEKYVARDERHYHNKRNHAPLDFDSRRSKPSYEKSVFSRPLDDGYSAYDKDSLQNRQRKHNSDDSERKSVSSASYNKSAFKKPQEGFKTERSLPYDPSRTSSWKKKKEYTSPDKDIQSESVQNANNATTSRITSDSVSTSKDISDSYAEKIQKLEPMQEEVKVLTYNELNNLAAKVIKAEILGNDALASKLREKLDAERKATKAVALSGRVHAMPKKEEIFLRKQDRHGISRPLHAPKHQDESSNQNNFRMEGNTSDKLSKKMSYFGEGSRHSLKEMFEREKLTTADDQIEMFVDAAISHSDATDRDYEIGDVPTKVVQKMGQRKQDDRDYNKAIQEHKRMNTALEKCQYCFKKTLKHLMITSTQQAYLCLPSCRSLVEGHCIIAPKEHISSSLLLDEDVLLEIQALKSKVINMWKEKNHVVIFMETCMNLGYCPHVVIECIPMPIDIGEMAPLYFKKAILESESEWAHNKQLIDLFKKDFEHSVPKGLPYFAVQFSTGGGYAHIIEDRRFSRHFGKEIVGGMMELDSISMRQNKEEFSDQAKKALKFIEQWKKYESSSC